MVMSKVFRTKNEENEQGYGKAQKAETLKKSITPKPAKPKRTEAVRKTSKKSEESRIVWWSEFRQYLREVVYELRKVVWPSRKETIGSTSVVLVIVILSGLFLGIVDFLLSRFIRLLIG
jgi:preprotein translocase subunit SecE